jgi:hypothetical protein
VLLVRPNQVGEEGNEGDPPEISTAHFPVSAGAA